MGKFLVRLLLFFALLFCLDRAVGIVAERLHASASGGEMYKENEISRQVKPDLLILGSSRAAHHYNPGIIGDSLGMSAYNAGKPSNGIISMYGRYRLIATRHVPKLIIYDLSVYDMLADDPTKYLPSLRLDYDRPGISELFVEVDPTERYKMLSHAYRVNSQSLGSLLHLKEQESIFPGGFNPIPYGQYWEDKNAQGPELILDSKRLRLFDEFLTEATKRSRVVAYISPLNRGEIWTGYASLVDICRRHNVMVMDHYDDKAFRGVDSLFSDPRHLNERGAELWSRRVGGELRRLLR